jgi:hypothetical protein
VEKSTTAMDEAMRRKMSSAHNKFEDIFQMAKTSEEGMGILLQNLEALSFVSANCADHTGGTRKFYWYVHSR